MEYSVKRIISCVAIIVGLFLGGVVFMHIGKLFSSHVHRTRYGTYYMTADTNIIFDLNDTLFTIDKGKALARLGFGDTLCYFLSGHNSADLEKKMFQVIESIQPSRRHDTASPVPMHKEMPMPSLMQDWMTGSLTSQELIDTVVPHIQHLGNEGFFASKREERLIHNAIELLFDPQIRCDLYRPIKRGIKLVERCKKLGHKVYLLSNMDTDLITLLKEKYPEIFELFDGIVISADINTMKPYKDMYDYLLASYHLDPSRSYLVDDQHENILGAQQAGIKGIACNHKKYKKVVSTFRDLGLLSTTKVA